MASKKKPTKRLKQAKKLQSTKNLSIMKVLDKTSTTL